MWRAGGGSTESHAVGTQGTVTLDGRFDCGYFVTVHVGREEFRGMLYYPPHEPAEVSMSAHESLYVFHVQIHHRIYHSFCWNPRTPAVNNVCGAALQGPWWRLYIYGLTPSCEAHRELELPGLKCRQNHVQFSGVY